MRPNNGPSHGEDTIFGTVRGWYKNLPLCTKTFFTVIVGIFLVQLVSGNDYSYRHFCLLARYTVEYFEVWRIFTSVLVHGGLLHVAFNMLAFVPIGQSLEQLVGTVQMFHLILVLTVLEGALYIAAGYLLSFTGIAPRVMWQCAIGFSGVIFGLIVVETAQSGATQRSVFGLFTVPAPLYPWALLLLWQIMMPSVSFLGHLAGVTAGQLWVMGALKPLYLSRPTTTWLEGTSLLRNYITPLPSFMPLPSGTLPLFVHETAQLFNSSGGHHPGSGGAGGGAGWSFGSSIGSFTHIFSSGWGGGSGQGHRLGQGGTHHIGGGGGPATGTPVYPPPVVQHQGAAYQPSAYQAGGYQNVAAGQHQLQGQGQPGQYQPQVYQAAGGPQRGHWQE
eukprot:CAMPEP_0202911522 /NCGR_PEP_ID=MMETSP1392-20130828/55193_1 /ASSEMBLY_ACC=CAM_ASM_000868 /TAXON_ID=225041 /ORGANISM="Chlamydomonas chlamydogama, Strain SAG 11-48b" /LENGTH=388 /DNA_ID=CAMNT_0049602061 /DNA_START=35 /DNA_END=1198 /DNA_ORIENTATION=-